MFSSESITLVKILQFYKIKKVQLDKVCVNCKYIAIEMSGSKLGESFLMQLWMVFWFVGLANIPPAPYFRH